MEENKNLHEKENRQRSIKIHGDWNLYQSIKPNSMDTFQDTLTNEDYERILRDLPPDSRDLSLLHEAERIREGFIGYHSYPTPFDCIENDTELMDGFFGWLDEVVLNLEHIKNTCLYYLINSPDDKGNKEETGKELNRLEALCNQVITIIIPVKV